MSKDTNIFPPNVEVLPSGNENSLFLERETQRHHATYQWGRLLVGYIRDGNLSMVQRFLEESAREGNRIGIGKLSENELRQAQYIGVGFTYQITFVAIEAGMFEADANQRADAFIQKIDQETSAQAVIQMIGEAILDWTRAISEIRSRQLVSPPIRACMEYIFEHLHSRITRKELAEVSGFSMPYLSVLFKKETGETIPEYILHLRIKSAEDMLLNTQHSVKDIGYYLNFSSQSYFIRCFKETTGVTPRAFRQTGIYSKSLQ